MKRYLSVLTFASLSVIAPAMAQPAQSVQQPATSAAPAVPAKPAPTSALMNLYSDGTENSTAALDQPHRSTEQLSQWVTDQALAVMTIDPKTWPTYSKSLAPRFVPYGFQEYTTSLASILQRLKSETLRVNAIGDGPTVLVNQGALNGTYHWLYQVPLILTYYDEDISTLKAQKESYQNQKVTAQIQLGRTAPNATDDMGLLIERWTLLSR